MQRPVPALGQHDIEQAVTVEVADADTRRRFTFALEILNTMKRGEDGRGRLRRPLIRVDEKKCDYSCCGDTTRTDE